MTPHRSSHRPSPRPSPTNDNRFKESSLTLLTLLTTTGTLLCCALPIIFVSLGFGATIAAATSSLPFLITLSQHKLWIFLFSAFMLVLSGWLLYRTGRHCPTDPEQAAICTAAYRWNKRIYWVSAGIWLLGFIAAYVLLPLQIWLGL